MCTITQEEERVKNFGLCLIIAGAIWGIIAFNMKTTVETESKTFGEGMYSIRVPSQTVHNLDLADQRRNHLTGAGITLLSGILLFGFGSMQSKTEGAKVVVTPERKCPFCAELIKSEAKVCRFCGKDLPEIQPEAVPLGFHKIRLVEGHTAICPKCTGWVKLKNQELSARAFTCNQCKTDIKFVVEA